MAVFVELRLVSIPNYNDGIANGIATSRSRRYNSEPALKLVRSSISDQSFASRFSTVEMGTGAPLCVHSSPPNGLISSVSNCSVTYPTFRRKIAIPEPLMFKYRGSCLDR